MKQYLKLSCTILLFAFFMMGIGFDAIGQNKPLDFGDVTTMAKGKLQNETYFSYSDLNNNNSENVYSLFRYGLRKDYELQFAWNSQNNLLVNQTFTSQNVSIGLKAYLLENSKYFPAITAVASMNLTTNSDHVDYAPSLNILYDKLIGNNFSLNGNYQATLNTGDSNMTYNYAINFETVVTNWMDAYVGFVATKSYGGFEKSAIYSEYIELGAMFWVKSGLRIYPFYDFSLDEGTPGIMNLAVLFSL